jgi:hypothetical protein
MNVLAKKIAEREGLKKQLTIAQIKEVLRVLVDLCFENQEEVGLALSDAIKKRAKKK